jgi:hypothetical protein
VQHALYSFGEVDHVVKEFRVLRIGTGQDLRRKIVALEYLEEVFEDGATIPTPESDSDLPWVTGLTAIEVYRGGQETKVYLKWRGFALYWNVFYRRAGSTAWTEYKRVYNPSCDVAGLDYGVLYNFAVSATDDPGDGEMVSITLRGKIDPPGDVPSITTTEMGYYVIVTWGSVTDFDLWGYELRVESIGEPYPYQNFVPNWGAAALLFKGNSQTFKWEFKAIGDYCLSVRAVDAFGNYSVNSALAFLDVGQPAIPTGMGYVLSGPNAILMWTAPQSMFAIDRYVIAYGDNFWSVTPVGTAKVTTFSVNVTWSGTRKYWVTAVDIAGNVGDEGSIDVIISNPGPITGLTPRVIDNNVLLQWLASAATATTLPIAYYKISKGDAYLTSVDIGMVQGTFTFIFEEQAGSFVYWIVGVDTAGNVGGTPVSIPATVNQPPDYIILQKWDSDFSGTKASALVSEGLLYAPINITETYEDHFVNNSFDTPQEQVDSGFAAWIMPVPTTATYTEVFEHDLLLTGLTKITVDISRDESLEWGTLTISPSIEVSTDGSSWGSPITEWSALESGFKYVRVILTFTGTGGNDIAAVSKMLVKLDLKQITDSGTVQVTSSGQSVDFNQTFLDIASITASVRGSSALYAVYDFVDVANPTHFHLYVFNSSGSDVSTAGHYVSWTARGV